MPSAAEKARIGALMGLSEAQLLLVRYLLHRLARNGTPATQLVRFHAQLDQLEASATSTRGRVAVLAERQGRATLPINC